MRKNLSTSGESVFEAKELHTHGQLLVAGEIRRRAATLRAMAIYESLAGLAGLLEKVIQEADGILQSNQRGDVILQTKSGSR